jgi:hypothetical protein
MAGSVNDDVDLICAMLDRANGDDPTGRVRAQDRVRGVVGTVHEAIEFA